MNRLRRLNLAELAVRVQARDPHAPTWFRQGIHVLVLAMIFVMFVLVALTFYVLFGVDGAQAAGASPVAGVYVSTGQDGGQVFLRRCASTHCPAVAVLAEGTPLVAGENPGEPWVQVLSPAGAGWVYGAYVAAEAAGGTP